jgi:hypothetical protein
MLLLHGRKLLLLMLLLHGRKLLCAMNVWI